MPRRVSGETSATGNAKLLPVFPRDLEVINSGNIQTASLRRLAATRYNLQHQFIGALESLLGRYKPAIEGTVNIGVLHPNLGGALGHDLYSPCAIADLTATGFRYWALGHVHMRSAVEGAWAIVMPGTPQGRDISEAGPKSVTLVTIEDDRSIHIEERTTSISQFERVLVDANGIEDWRELVSAISRALERKRSGVSSDHLVARVRIEGLTPFAWRIRRDTDLLKAEVDDRASVIGICWVDKLEILCRPTDRSEEPSEDRFSSSTA